jgi:O-acetyl-ADP-ribose deacetylase (regulator of RNase III)
MKEIDGDIIKLAKEGNFDLIIQGCNCFCRMGRGLAKQVAEDIPDAVRADNLTIPGDINKLGNFTIGVIKDYNNFPISVIYNCYTQYTYDSSKKPFDYDAFIMCLRKINHNNKGKRIGIPLIGAGLAGGDWEKIKQIIISELCDMDITIVHFKNN